MRDNERQSAIILSVIGIVPVVWLALLIAPSVKGGLPEILPSLMNVFNNPFHIEVCEDSVKTVLILLLCYLTIMLIEYYKMKICMAKFYLLG